MVYKILLLITARKERFRMSVDAGSIIYSALSTIPSLVSGGCALVFGILSYRMNKRETIKEYLTDDISTKIVEARTNIYKNDNGKPIKNKQLNKSFAIVCSHYNYYGLLLKKHYIPLWVFRGSNATAVTRCYKICENYIEKRRSEGNVDYAHYFEELYKVVIKNRAKLYAR